MNLFKGPTNIGLSILICWVGAILNARYATNYPAIEGARHGKIMGWTDWTHANQPPNVSAGSDQPIFVTGVALLNGTVDDDGQPAPPAEVTSQWSVISGPALVSIADVSAVDTTATFSTAGTYVLELSASDGQLSATDQINYG